jgi:hypothetical protein
MAAKIPPGLDPVLAKQALAGGKHWGASDQKRYDELVRKKNARQRSSRSGDGRNKGMFNYADMMNQFYSWQPDATDDPAGAAIKNTFMSNAIQGAMNTQQAKELAATNAELATNQMTVAAGLEFGNKSAIMEKEFNYGMQKMGAEYDYQEQFAKNEANRMNQQLALRGDIQQNQTRLEGAQNRLNIKTQGREELKQIRGKGRQDRKNIKAQGFGDRALQRVKGKQALEQIAGQGDQDVRKIGAQGDQDVRKIGAQGDQDFRMGEQRGKQALEQIAGQGDQDVRKIRATGRQERKTMQQATIEDDKKAARESKYARGLAGMF